MEINEVKALQKECEQVIFNLLVQFEKTTGTVINGVITQRNFENASSLKAVALSVSL